MDNCVYIEVIFPALNKTYDFILPYLMKIHIATKLMANIIMEKEHISVNQNKLLLFSKDSKILLNAKKSVYEEGIRDGACLLLI